MLLFALDSLLTRIQKAIWNIYRLCVKKKNIMNKELLPNLLCQLVMSESRFAASKVGIKNKFKDL